MIRTFALLALLTTPAFAAEPCAPCAAWNTPQMPFRVYGNTYYVGPHGLAAILVTSDQGHILIDGALADSAGLIADYVSALGFRLEDVKIILNTHAHYDHAGGIAELQRQTGAKVMASIPSIAEMVGGMATRDDPQAAIADHYPAVARATPIKDGETVTLGPLKLTAHFTPGHTPGGTTWTWTSCEGTACRNMVYADSLTAVSAPDFRFSADAALVAGFKKSFATVAALPCDILLTPHPEASALWDRLAKREAGAKDALATPGACRAYAETARMSFEKRLASEGPP